MILLNAKSLVVFLFVTFQTVQMRKTVKLIVPHRIKYVHHTHILVLSPLKKKKSAGLVEIREDDEPDYHSGHHLYHQRESYRKSPHLKGYIVPYMSPYEEEEAERRLLDTSSVSREVRRRRYRRTQVPEKSASRTFSRFFSSSSETPEHLSWD